MEFKMHNVIAATILGVSMAAGIAYSGHTLSEGIANFRTADRAVTVKGLAEKEVKSDLASWTIQFKNAGDDLEPTYAQNEADRGKVIEFLKKQGFQDNEISMGGMQVNDLSAQEYGSDTKPQYRYILRNSININTRQVDTIQKSIEASGHLVQAGVLIENLNYVRYYFTQLNTLRPQMLAEATHSARILAEQFAKDSGSRVGGIKNANQGVFKIIGRDNGEGDISSEDTFSLYKKIRVVSTIDYFLVQ